MRFPSPPLRALTIALTGASLLATACGTGGGGTAAPATTASPAPATPQASTATPPAIPDTPVGDQLRWFLGAVDRVPIPAGEYAEHFTAQFVEQVPLDRFNQITAALAGLRLTAVREEGPGSLAATLDVGGQVFDLPMSVDAAGKISGLRVTPATPPAPAPANWTAFDERLRAVAPRVGFLAAEVTRRGGCRPVHAVAPGRARPLGSMFKLHVLDAVAARIGRGDLRWDTRLTVTPELRSLGAGLGDRPDGTRVTVREAAGQMISVSDNTATDLLVHRVGRRAVEARLPRVPGNVPLLTTRDLFVLKGVDHPRLAREYASRDTRARRAYLEGAVARTELSRISPWTSPRDIDTMEWFASPSDLCRAFSALSGLTRQRALAPVGEVMSVNDGGLALDAATWPTVWFKGGSEPGVLDLGYLARHASGRTYVVILLTSDTDAAVHEPTAVPELLTLARAAFTLTAED